MPLESEADNNTLHINVLLHFSWVVLIFALVYCFTTRQIVSCIEIVTFSWWAWFLKKKELLELGVTILNESEITVYSQRLKGEYYTAEISSTLDIIRMKRRRAHEIAIVTRDVESFLFTGHRFTDEHITEILDGYTEEGARSALIDLKNYISELLLQFQAHEIFREKSMSKADQMEHLTNQSIRPLV